MRKFWDTLGIEGTGISRFQTIFFYWRICIKYLYKALCESVTSVVLKLIDRNMHLKNLKCFLLYVKYLTVCYVKILLNLSCFVLLQWVVLMSSVSQTILKFPLLLMFLLGPHLFLCLVMLCFTTTRDPTCPECFSLYSFLDTRCWHAMCSSWCSALWLSLPP